MLNDAKFIYVKPYSKCFTISLFHPILSVSNENINDGGYKYDDDDFDQN